LHISSDIRYRLPNSATTRYYNYCHNRFYKFNLKLSNNYNYYKFNLKLSNNYNYFRNRYNHNNIGWGECYFKGHY